MKSNRFWDIVPLLCARKENTVIYPKYRLFPTSKEMQLHGLLKRGSFTTDENLYKIIHGAVFQESNYFPNVVNLNMSN
jgi:hypothetical protein